MLPGRPPEYVQRLTFSPMQGWGEALSLKLRKGELVTGLRADVHSLKLQT